MRHLICDYLHWLAKRATLRAEQSKDRWWREAWLRRARFWADCELLGEGLIDWQAFKKHRRHTSLRPTIHTRGPL